MKEANFNISLICFDDNDNFDHSHVNVVTFVPRKLSKKPQFFHKNADEKLCNLNSIYKLLNEMKIDKVVMSIFRYLLQTVLKMLLQ